jgi:hypothetical protein
MLTQIQKDEIMQLVDDEKERLGSYRSVASKCKVSEATISQLRKGSYGAGGDTVYRTIGLALGYEFDTGEWNIAETTNFRIVYEVLTDAMNESMFLGVSHRAGSGKTATSNAFKQHHRRNAVFKLNCREWTGRQFLLKVIHEIGAELPKGYASVSLMIESISTAFKRMASQKPLLILDQANSLKPSALRTIIHIFNETEGILGMAILGTDNLEYEIKRGVRLNRMGYDELDSRFGRTYIHLIGATLADCRKICEANGIDDKKIQSEIFHLCNPIRKEIQNGEESRTILVVEDKRILKNKIKRKKLQNKYS